MRSSVNLSQDVFSEAALSKIFKVRVNDPTSLASRESQTLEFRETYSMNAIKDKLRTIAGFANHNGGYIVFGVKDSPRKLLGLQGTGFSTLKTEQITGMFNQYFSPEIEWAPHEYWFLGMPFGIIYIYQSDNKPIVCTSQGPDSLHEGEIYYRYSGRTERIKYPELSALLECVRVRERDLWMKLINRIASVGVRNAAVMDSVSGIVTGGAGSFIIDKGLLPKLSFISEGHFVESVAAPAFKLIGNVEVIESDLIQPVSVVAVPTTGINFPEIVSAFLNRDTVPDPIQYIKALIYQTTSSWPVYYFMKQAGMTPTDVVTMIDDSESTSSARRYLRDRMVAPVPNNAIRALDPIVASYRQDIISNSFANIANSEIVATDRKFYHAVLSLCVSDVNVSILFPFLKTIFDDYYRQMPAAVQVIYRRALVHLDTICFAHDTEDAGDAASQV